MDEPDSALIERILQGDESASGKLYRRYARELYRYLYFRTGREHHDAEDLTQDVLRDAWRNLRAFDLSRDFWAWLCGISARRLSKYYRSRSRTATSADEDFSTGALAEFLKCSAPLPDQVVDGREAKETVELALSSLPPKYQRLLRLKYLAERSMAEIAEELGITAAAVNSALQRARAALRLNLNTYRKELTHE